MRDLKRRFWMWAMGVTLGWDRAYLFCLQKACEATEWGEGADCSGGTGEEPF